MKKNCLKFLVTIDCFLLAIIRAIRAMEFSNSDLISYNATELGKRKVQDIKISLDFKESREMSLEPQSTTPNIFINSFDTSRKIKQFETINTSDCIKPFYIGIILYCRDVNKICRFYKKFGIKFYKPEFLKDDRLSIGGYPLLWLRGKKKMI
ncbi:MAG: hypothetical protein ACRYE9_01110 [Janthinobacterium lividum]